MTKETKEIKPAKANSEKALSTEEQAKKIAVLRQLSGEGNRMAINYVNFNGEVGKYLRGTNKKDEKTGKTIKEDLGDTFEGVLLKKRNRINTYTPKRQDLSYNSAEFDGMGDRIKLYDGNKKLVSQGTFRELKEEYNTDGQKKLVAMEAVLYIKQQGAEILTKLCVSGASLSKLFDYFGSFGNDDSMTRYVTKLGAQKESNEFGDYFVMTFQKGDPIDIDEAINMQKALSTVLAITSKKVEVSNSPTSENQGEVIDVDADLEEGLGDIKVEDIPF